MPLLTVGTRLGSYVVEAQIGAGGMGEVYRARDTKLDRAVAIKVLPALFAADPDRAARFEREAKALAALNHPNILAIHDFGVTNGTAYAAMELLDGQTLRDRLAERPLSPRKTADYAAQIARGLSAAHDRGIVHRDLKPENIVVLPDGRVKILDFGLALHVQAASISATDVTHARTDPNMVLGTVGYMSPEQVRGDVVDFRSDIFSLGAVIYKMLSGRRAFVRDTAAETMTAILREDPPELDAARRSFRCRCVPSCGIVWRRVRPSGFSRRAISRSRSSRLPRRPPGRDGPWQAGSHGGGSISYRPHLSPQRLSPVQCWACSTRGTVTRVHRNRSTRG